MTLYDKIKEEVPMKRVLEQYGISVNRSGFASCPFHNEDTPSMKVYPDSFYCYGCGTGGDVIRFVAEIERICNSQAALRIAQDYGITQEKQPHTVLTEAMKREREKKRALEARRDEYNKKIEEFRANDRALKSAKGEERARLLARQEYLDYWFGVTEWK